MPDGVVSQLVLGADGRPMPRARTMAGGMMETANASASTTSQELAGWHPGLRSADGSWLYERDQTVARIRDLVRNNGYASAAVQRQLDSVIGAGLKLSARPMWEILDPAGKLDRKARRAMERLIECEFRAYAYDPRFFIDSSRQTNLSGLFGLMYRHRIVDGEAVAVPHWIEGRAGSRFSTAIEVVDPDRLVNPMGATDSEYMRKGVELDSWGAWVALHIRVTHPSEIGWVERSFETVRVPRETEWGRIAAIHHFERDQANQHRGRSLLSAVVKKLKMGERYDETEMQAALLNAIYAAYIESPMDNEFLAEMLGDDRNSIGAYQAERASFYDKRNIYLNGSQITKLFPGDKFNFRTVERPHAGHWPFLQAVIRSVATATGSSYEQVSGDWSQGNYSSLRAAMIEVFKFIHARRNIFGESVARAIYSLWLEEAIDNGTIKLPPGLPGFWESYAAWTACQWIGPARGWVDPTKEAQAAQMRMDGQISTLRDEAAEQGVDWEDQLDQLAHENDLRQELGLPSPSAVGPVTHASDIEAMGGRT